MGTPPVMSTARRATVSTDEATRTHRDLLEEITRARAVPITATGSDEVVAMATSPREAAGDVATEWTMLDRAVHAMEARDWPAVIVAVSGASLASPSFAYRLRDLMEQHHLPADRLWLEVDSSHSVLRLPGVVRALAQRHLVGCRMPIDDAFEERALLPDLVATGISFAWLEPGDARSIADDLSALIAGRSLLRRARMHGISVIGPPDLSPDMVPPPVP
jgi:EAL domain-containing protein (putative c-di-GMP-specific phosphodiesterase class I)